MTAALAPAQLSRPFRALGRAAKWTFNNPVITLGSLNTALVLDWHYSVQCTRAGICHEGNPLMAQPGTPAFTAVKGIEVGVVTGLYIWAYKRTADHPTERAFHPADRRILQGVSWGLAGAMGLLDWHTATLGSKQAP